MRKIGVLDAYLGLVVAAGAVGAALVGLAVGQSFRFGSIASVGQHPLFSAGAQCLTSSAICGLLLLTGVRR